MTPIAIDRQGLPFQRRDDEIGDDAPILRVHMGSIGVEDPDHLDVDPELAVVIEEEGFGAPFSFVVTGARADGIDPPPVIFPLGMDLRIAIDFAGGRLQDPRGYAGQARAC